MSIFTLTDDDKTSQYYSVVTNSEGIGELKLDKSPGKYTVNCTYGGNENYTGNSTLQRLEILEVVVAEESSSSSSDDGLPDVDASGITREEAEKYGWTYTPEHGGHYIGSHDAWDEEAGVYHD